MTACFIINLLWVDPYVVALRVNGISFSTKFLVWRRGFTLCNLEREERERERDRQRGGYEEGRSGERWQDRLNELSMLAVSSLCLP